MTRDPNKHKTYRRLAFLLFTVFCFSCKTTGLNDGQVKTEYVDPIPASESKLNCNATSEDRLGCVRENQILNINLPKILFDYAGNSLRGSLICRFNLDDQIEEILFHSIYYAQTGRVISLRGKLKPQVDSELPKEQLCQISNIESIKSIKVFSDYQFLKYLPADGTYVLDTSVDYRSGVQNSPYTCKLSLVSDVDTDAVSEPNAANTYHLSSIKKLSYLCIKQNRDVPGNYLVSISHCPTDDYDDIDCRSFEAGQRVRINVYKTDEDFDAQKSEIIINPAIKGIILNTIATDDLKFSKYFGAIIARLK